MAGLKVCWTAELKVASKAAWSVALTAARWDDHWVASKVVTMVV